MAIAARERRKGYVISLLFGIAVTVMLSALWIYRVRDDTIQGNSHRLRGPVAAIITTPGPTWTPNTTERLMRSVNIDPTSATLGDLVKKLGPPDTVQIGRYGAESPTANVQFFYETRSVYCYTEWQTPLRGISRHLRVSACEPFDPNDSLWPAYGEWNGFDD